MSNPYVPILLLFAIAFIFSGAFVGLSALFGPKKPTVSKNETYECGMPIVGSPRERFSVKFYLVAIIFILFDVEAVFLFPWAVLLNTFKAAGAGLFIFWEMLAFLVVLFLGLVYVWKRGALDWER
ncbi:MAG: NADH-quinone oxidoreductase subunit A [Deltaproteobacteria bacterium]|nr:NADH-quinone oxidoreductase subunit A [Deltaproteobacteria bacterium]